MQFSEKIRGGSVKFTQLNLSGHQVRVEFLKVFSHFLYAKIFLNNYFIFQATTGDTTPSICGDNAGEHSKYHFVFLYSINYYKL